MACSPSKAPDAGAARLPDQLVQQEVRPVRAVELQDRVERVQPLPGLDRVHVADYLDLPSASADSSRVCPAGEELGHGQRRRRLILAADG